MSLVNHNYRISAQKRIMQAFPEKHPISHEPAPSFPARALLKSHTITNFCTQAARTLLGNPSSHGNGGKAARLSADNAIPAVLEKKLGNLSSFPGTSAADYNDHGVPFN
jgi:hypothetical protein